MSRIGVLGLLAALSLLLAPGSVSTQQEEERLRQRLDSLRPLLEAAREDLTAFELEIQRARAQAAAAAADLDTLRIGQMTIVTPIEQSETARELFTEAWEEHYAGIAESPGLERARFSFQWSNEEVPIYLDGYGQQHIQFRRYVRRDRVAAQIRHAIGVSITYDLAAFETDVGRWVQGEPHRDHDVQQIYRQLATTESTATRSCYEGDVEACEAALGLGIEGNAVQIWYTREERRALVGATPRLGAQRATSEAWDECVNGSDIESCDSLLTDTRGRWAPLLGTARASLLWLALERGGDGAWSRLVEDPEMPAEEALVHASGLDLEALVGEWRLWILDGRPDVYSGLLPKSGMAVVWTLVFAAFAMRSTRWRLG